MNKKKDKSWLFLFKRL